MFLFLNHQEALRRGRGNNSPLQFGQIAFISCAHTPQKVHSWLHIKASASAASALLQCSHLLRISKAIGLRSLAGYTLFACLESFKM
jgi:hypothetical protein